MRGGDDRRTLGAEALQGVEEGFGARPVEARGGLVEQQHLRTHHQRSGQRYALLLAQTQRKDGPRRQMLHAHLRQRRASGMGCGRIVEALLQQTQGDVAQGRIGEELIVRILQYGGDAPLVTVHGAGRRLQQTVEQRKQRRLPRAVGAQQNQALARSDA